MADMVFEAPRNGIAKAALTGLFCAALLLPPVTALSQTSTTLGSNTFIQEEEGGKWFLQFEGELFEVKPDVVTVKFKDTIRINGTPLEIEQGHKAYVYAIFQTEVIRENRLGFVDLRVPRQENPIEFVRALLSTGLFDSAEVNTFGKYLQTIPDDPRFDEQWNLDNTGQTGGTPDADIDAPEAWDITTGDPSVIVGVLDSGTDIDHEDLGCNIWVNPGEDVDGDGVVWDVPDDINGIDDDGNGLIDDIVGWDFGNGDNDPRGPFYHGTHVAGIVGACGNNATGIMGVAGGFGIDPGSQLMTIGVGDDRPEGDILDDAILYAADMGAQIITLSLSVTPSAAIDAALDQAYNVDGVFIDNASGNDFGAVAYPATDPNVMAVGSTDHNDERAGSSNFGPELEVVAPGVSVLSTQPFDVYDTSSGTSFASPHVAGLAALMLSHNPAATNVELRDCIAQTAEDEVGDPAEDTPGRDDFYGSGRINAAAALDCVLPNQPPVCDANGPYVAECQGDVTLDGTGSYDPDGDPLSFLWTGNFTGGSAVGPTPAVQFTLPGVEIVTLEVDDGTDTDSCTAQVTVEDTIPPSVMCNNPMTIVPPDAPISFTATVDDLCQGPVTPEITDFDCFKFTKMGKRVDKTESCVISIEGDTITIEDSGGVGDNITWTVVATDNGGNTVTETCALVVANPGKSLGLWKGRAGVSGRRSLGQGG